ncbi:hypothetical protein MLD38_007788 [Melastoma candidum]|uniref:Uncharacterized protein n=1 Tax=Melastoma candidum TaxID=119954 RepID=A0ACB9S0R9_9MYRT|nr:hypothetical protein MLD38_007788 [Melastoma candidum]
MGLAHLEYRRRQQLTEERATRRLLCPSIQSRSVDRDDFSFKTLQIGATFRPGLSSSLGELILEAGERGLLI